MEETLFFKKDNNVYKAIFGDDSYPDNPRKTVDNLGVMVFPKNRTERYTLGDEQPQSFWDFFKEQLDESLPNDYFEGTIDIDLPSVDEIQNNENLSRFIAGTKESGFYFDKNLFAQELDAVLSNITDLYSDNIDNLTGGIPVDEKTNRLTNHYSIDLRTSSNKGYTAAENSLYIIKKALSEYLSDVAPANIFNYTDSIQNYNKIEDLTETQLYEKWAATKLCVLPIDIYEHSGLTCHKAPVRKTTKVNNDRDDGIIYNDGFIYIDNNNPEVLEFMKIKDEDKPARTIDDAKKWAELCLTGEIETYASYLEGDTHTFSLEKLNPQTLEWDEVESFSGIYGSDLNLILEEQGYKIRENISENKAIELENTPTPEYKKACWNNFIESVKKVMPDFDNKVDYASSAVLYSMKQKYNESSLVLKALNSYMKEMGCTSKDKTLEILNNVLGLNFEKAQIKEFDPFFYNNDKNGKQYEVYFHTNPNPNSSNYHSKSAAELALVVDTENKRYGLLSGSYSFSGNHFNNYQKAPDLSIKKLREKIEQLDSYGFKFQKFTTKAGEYAQGNPKQLYPKAKQKDLDIGYER